jgi:hypothetical protein
VSARATICCGSVLRYSSRSGASTQSLQHPTQLERKSRGPTTDDKAPQTARIQSRGEKRGPSANIGSDDVRLLKPKRISNANDELAHRPRRQQRIPTLGMTEPRQVNCHQMRTVGQPRPRRLEGEQALRPRAQQKGVIVSVLALGEADGQPVDRPEPRLDGRVRPRAHDVAPHCLSLSRSASASRRVLLAGAALASARGQCGRAVVV